MTRPSPDPATLRWAVDSLPDFRALEDCAVTPLPAAGSDRTLWRLRRGGRSAIVVSNPGAGEGAPNENDSFVYLSGHLRQKGLPVPEVFAYERSLDAYVMEDLGDVDLFSLHREGMGAEDLLEKYCDAVALLARMQTAALEGFDPSRCLSPGPYDRALMRSGESGCFRRELLDGYLALGAESASLEEDCRRLADEAAGAGTRFFLHRDFQSMNLKIHEGRLWIIDFQGARPGPAQYDLAALLYDPYVSLPRGVRMKLFAFYLESCRDRDGWDAESFMALFPPVAAHRLMQALGAYAKLGHRRGKKMFLSFIPAALDLLEEVLADLGPDRYPALAAAAARARRRLPERG